MDKFKGNPLQYQYFSAMYKEVVERKIKDPVERLTNLIKFTDGEANDLIKHCIHVTPDIGYDTAITLLNKRYGNPHSLLASYRKEVKLLLRSSLGMLWVSESFIILFLSVRPSPKIETDPYWKRQKPCVKTTRWFQR